MQGSHNARVIQYDSCSRLFKERIKIIGVRDTFRVWQFDCNVAVELHIACKVDRGKSPGTEETLEGSAPLEAFLATSRANWIYGEVADAFRTVGPNNLFPGLVIPALVIAGARAVQIGTANYALTNPAAR